ncbi:MAG: adenosine kinase [Treponema sp.]|jgi:sugar/nucleoside kinase (ribokinase family)|nr:adenosine kinase [Treponema sp.]
MAVQNQKTLELLCVGNALVDIFAQADEDILLHFGLTAPAQHLGYEKISDLLAVLSDLSAGSGGGAANVAKIAALLGLNSGFIGTVGSAGVQPKKSRKEGEPGRKPDYFARVFERDLINAGVTPILFQGESPTGVCFILQTPAGETRIGAAPAAALELTAEDIGEEIIRAAKVVVIDGFLLGRQELVQRILELAEQYGTAVALDAGAAELAKNRALEIVRYCQDYPLILFMNEEEALSFYLALNQAGEEQLRQEGPEKHEWYVRNVFPFLKGLTQDELFPVIVVKLGPRGAVAFAGGAMFREETTPIIPLETTGAGDAFCAAFLAAWIRNKSIAECAALGNRAAREILDVKGTQVNKKQFAHLSKLLALP